MARAKSTDRAEARRRYRQTATVADEAAASEAEAAEARPGRRSAPATSQPAGRPSIGAAFRNAYRPADVRADIAALPSLLRTKGFLASVALILVGALVTLVPNPVTKFLYSTLLLPPAMAPIFLVGWFAPRASYLLGLVVGVIDVVVYLLVIASYGTASTGLTPEQFNQQVIAVAIIGPSSGLLFAAAAAWYRRFLQFSNQGRGRPAAKSNSRARR